MDRLRQRSELGGYKEEENTGEREGRRRYGITLIPAHADRNCVSLPSSAAFLIPSHVS